MEIPPPAKKVNLDKNWTVCDNHPGSAYYGNCYTEFDNFGEGDLEYMSTSSDGGRTWIAPISRREPEGLSGQRSCADGTVIVPSRVSRAPSARSDPPTAAQHGARRSRSRRSASTPTPATLRTSPLPSAEIDAAGTAYVAWEDCRFESKCAANDIVFTSSADGVNWGAVKRVPIDPVGSGVDHFIPGLAVDPATSGAAGHLALTYYYYPNAACTAATCQLDVGFISSPDAGVSWSAPTAAGRADVAGRHRGHLAGPDGRGLHLDVVQLRGHGGDRAGDRQPP